jgi:hypothetical protein
MTFLEIVRILYEDLFPELNQPTKNKPPIDMSPAMISLIISLVEEAVKLCPEIIADLQTIFGNPNPTPADWEALRQKVLSISYAGYVPASALPASAPAAASQPVTPASTSSNAPISQSGANPS